MAVAPTEIAVCMCKHESEDRGPCCEVGMRHCCCDSDSKMVRRHADKRRARGQDKSA